ncbi:hypothetical protein CVT24_005046 [Panaeolus cyanescens]|uniref:F-box domain-containing protein n=1 Tax=Panaeolus cyanescens TaxID=181874 RepID=A0A409VPT2_9AGAR|nr:hypothetical protein CVT24_005046 [Panaeolus cyanescens]
MLENLSGDLLLNIGTNLERDDHKNLRLVSSSLTDVFALLVLNSIRIWIEGPGVNSDSNTSDHLELLQWLANPRPHHKSRIQAIRKLHIASLSPYNRPKSPVNIGRYSTMEAAVVSCLRPALFNLSNIHAFIWEVQAKDPDTTHHIVAETVSAYPQLQTIHIFLTHLTSPVLHHFKNLTSIEYSAYRDDIPTFPVPVVTGFAKAITQSPNLRSLGFTAAEGQENISEHVFEYCRVNASALPLRDLTLLRVLSPLPLLPHIDNLNTIVMINVPSKDGFSLPSLQEFWVEVKGKGLTLERICVDRIPPSLVDYIESYQGLKFFILDNDGSSIVNGPSDDIDAERFYLEALPRHASTLERLDLHLSYEDKWCFSSSLARVIAQWHSLKFLGLGFGFGQLQDGSSSDDSEDDQSIEKKSNLHILFDTILEHCPNIRTINIYHPLPDKGTSSAHMGYAQMKGLWDLTRVAMLTWEGTIKDSAHGPAVFRDTTDYTMLENLSDDLLLNIGTYLECSDHKNLRLVSNSVTDVFALIVLKSISLWVEGPEANSDKISDHLELIQWLADPPPQHRSRIRAIQKLSIISLSPYNYPGSFVNVDEYNSMERDFVKYLRSGLLNLSNVHTFAWEVQAKDPVTTHHIVAETVSTYRHLESIQVYLTHLTTPVLHHFKNLQSIAYRSYAVNDDIVIPVPVITGFAQAIVQSPKLRSLTFTGVKGQEYMVDHVFEHCRANGSILPLRNITLIRVHSPIPLLPRISHLNTIEIIDIPSDSGFALPSLETFWLAVKDRGIQLERIQVDRVPSSLVDYIGSYQGLKSFVLKNEMSSVVNRPHDDVDAERFYFESLPRHVPTLEILDLHLAYEDKWCFSSLLASSLIAQCTALKMLGLGFGFGQLESPPHNLEDGRMYDQKLTLHILLDTIFKKCPGMRTVNIYHPFPDRDTSSNHMESARMEALWDLTQDALLTWEGRFEDIAHRDPAFQVTVQVPDYHPLSCFNPKLHDDGFYRYKHFNAYWDFVTGSTSSD